MDNKQQKIRCSFCKGTGEIIVGSEAMKQSEIVKEQMTDECPHCQGEGIIYVERQSNSIKS